jgi:hypothetical protein
MSEVKLVSVDKQRKKITVTPTGWVVIAVVGLLVVTGVGWGVWKITRGVSVQPLAAAPEVVLTVEPTVVPAVVEDGGNAVPDLTEVEELAQLREHFLEAWTWFYAPELPHNLEDVGYYFAPIPSERTEAVFRPGIEWWFGIEEIRQDITADAEAGLLWRVMVDGGDWRVMLQQHGAGWAQVAAQYEGSCTVEAIAVTTGEVADSRESRCMQYEAGVVWDAVDARWKIASLWLWEPIPSGDVSSK